MQISKFTYRDFISFFLVGIIAVICVIAVTDSFENLELGKILSSKVLDRYTLLLSIFMVAVIYLTGHFVQGFDYIFLLSYTKSKRFWNKYTPIRFIGILLEIIIYRHRNVYYIDKAVKNESFNSVECFWESCASVRMDNNFAACEYWFVLGELFEALYFLFFFSTIIELVFCDFISASIFAILAAISYFKAAIYSRNFVNTVKRNMKSIKN